VLSAKLQVRLNIGSKEAIIVWVSFIDLTQLTLALANYLSYLVTLFQLGRLYGVE
jgi:hypothetical protein